MTLSVLRTRRLCVTGQNRAAGHCLVDVGRDWRRQPGGGAAAGDPHLLRVQDGQEEEGEPIEDPFTATPWI